MYNTPLEQRPGYRALDYAASNSQGPAEANQQLASRGPGVEQRYEGDHPDGSSRGAVTAVHSEEHSPMGHLQPAQLFPEGYTNVHPIDPAREPKGVFSRGVHPEHPSEWRPPSEQSRTIDRSTPLSGPQFRGNTTYDRYPL